MCSFRDQIIPMKNFLLAAGMLCSSVLSAQWTQVGSAISISDLEVVNNNLFLSAITIQKRSDGDNFTAATTGISGTVKSMVFVDGQLYAGTNGSNWFRSADLGQSWTAMPGRGGLISVGSTSIWKSGNNIVYGTDGNGGLHYSSNGGSSWSGADMPSTANKTIGKNITALGSNLFACTLNGVVKSTDNGQSWTAVSGLPTFSGSGTSMCAINGGLLVSIYGNGVYRSLDGGNSWNQVLGGGLGTISNNITRLKYQNGIVFAGGAASQVHYSSDNGSTWTEIPSTGMLGPVLIVQSLAYFNGHLYAGTNLNLYKIPLSVASSVAEATALQHSAYPNPTNDVLNLRWQSGSFNQLQVRDVQGRLVSEQAIDLLTTEIQLEVGSWSPGLYCYELRNANGQQLQGKFLKR